MASCVDGPEISVIYFYLACVVCSF